MESKKRNKLGTAILCGLPPLAALAVTAGVVIATAKPVTPEPEPTSEFKIVEPTEAAGKVASSFASADKWETTGDKIKYTFTFPGEFTLQGANYTLDDLQASATIIDDTGRGDPREFEMKKDDSVITKTGDNTFKVSLCKEFMFEAPPAETMANITGGTQLKVSNFVISNKKDSNVHNCTTDAFTVKMNPSVVLNTLNYEFCFAGEDPDTRFELDYLPFVNMIPDTYPKEIGDAKAKVIFTFKDSDNWKQDTSSEQITKPWSWYIDEYTNTIEFYGLFTADTKPTSGSSTEFGFELTYDDSENGTTTFFKKEIGVGPKLIITSNDNPTLAGNITEPTNGSEAKTYTSSNFFSPATQEGSIKYTYTFPDSFALNTTAIHIEDLQVSAKITKKDDPSVTYTIDKADSITQVGYNKFQISLCIDFDADDPNSMANLSANTELNISDLTIYYGDEENTEQKYVCTKTYTAKVNPTLLFGSEYEEFFDVKEDADGKYIEGDYQYVNALDGSGTTTGTLSITFRNKNWEVNPDKCEWKPSTVNPDHIYFKQYFTWCPTVANQYNEFGLELIYNGTTYFKKDLGVGPGLIAYIPE